jgi:hypothetical protein
MRSRKMKKGLKDLLLFSTLAAACFWLSFQLKFPNGRIMNRGAIVSDVSAYYVYLPATFLYHWDIKQFPPGQDKKCEGFVLNRKTGKIETKVTYGVALMYSPVFLVTHLIATEWNLRPDGFSEIYQKMTCIPGVIYLILALYFLKRFLEYYYRPPVPLLTCLLIFAGTNLYFFSMMDGLMSHVFSFFFFSLFLFLVKRFMEDPSHPFGQWVLISFVVALAALIRPTNLIILSWLVFLDTTSWKEAGRKALFFLKPKYVITVLVAGIILYFPQFLYWRYLSGSWVYYSYPGENFANWSNPRILSIWFAPLNGLFLYSPLVLAFIAASVRMIIRKAANGLFILVFFLVITYIFASWHSWFFGGSFGARPFVEFYSLLALPFAYLLNEMPRIRNLFSRTLILLFILISCYYNLQLTYNYRWYGSSTWAWDEFRRHLDDAHLYYYDGKTFTYIDDSETANDGSYYHPVFKPVHSPTVASSCDSFTLSNRPFVRSLSAILRRPVKKVTASVWICPADSAKTGAYLVCQVEDWKMNLSFYKSFKIDEVTREPGKWAKIEKTITIPEWVDQRLNFRAYVYDQKRTRFYVDDFMLKFE